MDNAFLKDFNDQVAVMFELTNFKGEIQSVFECYRGSIINHDTIERFKIDVNKKFNDFFGKQIKINIDNNEYIIFGFNISHEYNTLTLSLKVTLNGEQLDIID